MHGLRVRAGIVGRVTLELALNVGTMFCTKFCIMFSKDERRRVNISQGRDTIGTRRLAWRRWPEAGVEVGLWLGNIYEYNFDLRVRNWGW